MFQKSKLPLVDVLKVVGVVLTLALLFVLRDIILILVVALILAMALTQPVNWLKTKKVPRLLGASIVYLVAIGLFAFLVYLILPPLATEMSHLADNLPQYGESVQHYFKVLQRSQGQAVGQALQNVLEQGSSKLGSMASGIIPALKTVFGRLFHVFVLIVISFYLVLQGPKLKQDFVGAIPAVYRGRWVGVMDRIQKKLRHWFYGVLILGVIIGVMTFIGLYIIGIKYALVLAIVAGILELLPGIGPVLSAIPAVILGLAQSPVLAIVVVILYIAVQQLENHLIVPQVMKKAVGLNPLLVIISLLIGFKLLGLLGGILAVPIVAGLGEVVKELWRKS
ncbi:MAG: hypothetical protein COS76_04165 [Candidatus Portnoybacteria bacterium CG06_land_8_20_14_3_00_39_12]|uniref:AI-2E family transporter n=1 Tax=Candidatus Portnoybacteria bacterium CG06_land_8_20_14_3_00_39_12 TaxID=1974809 RepID=A0A2M7AVY5_9BACT|nr:MAG: hypothetical protein COS76_04165 [Candidatus Portnoybacteria bacterium CG06_land_8_20_14_3_00_39_12]